MLPTLTITPTYATKRADTLTIVPLVSTIVTRPHLGR